jgi:hypothetical protein
MSSPPSACTSLIDPSEKRDGLKHSLPALTVAGAVAGALNSSTFPLHVKVST